jgi:glycosyltransferase involved in cell wall biosynthesis
MHLVQVCNVGNICGGTAACAWTIARALPEYRHTIWWLTPPTAETRRAFADASHVVAPVLAGQPLERLQPDVMLLHNTKPRHIAGELPGVTIDYRHSQSSLVGGDRTVACSEWLREEIGDGRIEDVLYQPVPRPLRPDYYRTRSLRERLVVGRICTPTRRKWPAELIQFYELLATRHLDIDWEFIGCPRDQQPALLAACRGQARFHAAGWRARSRFWQWDVLLHCQPGVTESFGRTVAEGMRAGCIPVVDNRGGFREQVTPETGFLCDTAADFAEALGQLADPALRQSLREAARERADEWFSLQSFRERWRQLLHEIAR